MIKSGLSYYITDLGSNIEALTARALLIKGTNFNHSKHYSKHVCSAYFGV